MENLCTKKRKAGGFVDGAQHGKSPIMLRVRGSVVWMGNGKLLELSIYKAKWMNGMNI